MHMADALVSPVVGCTMLAISAGAIAYSSSVLKKEQDERRVPLMGVLGAFIFAAQMINFTIPGTGSSGHLGGGMLLAAMLGPHAALLVMASVLLVQALFFADGGLLALGCNIFNMGVIPAYIVYPLVYRRMLGSDPTAPRLSVSIIISSLVTLQLGPLAVVAETMLSGISSLPFSAFLLLMQPIHLPIGIVEGVVTASILSIVRNARPEILHLQPVAVHSGSIRTALLSFLVATLLTGSLLSLFASGNPDGLEWAIKKITGAEEVKGKESAFHKTMEDLQKRTSFMPDYSFRKPEATAQAAAGSEAAGTSLSGLVGGAITLILLTITGLFFNRRKQPA